LPDPTTAPALKTVLSTKYGKPDFHVGVAIESDSITGVPSLLLKKHFNAITAENAMKPDTIWPNASPATNPPTPRVTPNFAPADELVTFATNNGIEVRAHTLLWHQTVPTWLIQGNKSTPDNYRADVQQHMRDYINMVMEHFPNVYAWDVVNEAASDNASSADGFRTDSPWYQAYSFGGKDGREYVRDAFYFATLKRTAMNRVNDMALMLNDYNTELPGKRANVIKVVQYIMADSPRGTLIDGVGHQFHLQVGADATEVTAAFQAVEVLGLINHVTELDVSLYADPGTCFSARTIPPCLADYGASPPQSALSLQATTYRALFNAFNRPSVQSVTTWGLADNHTWLNTWPVNRTNRPLLFDTSLFPKWAFWTVVDPAIVVP
jgi:endo-1,4-beta-xylanase